MEAQSRILQDSGLPKLPTIPEIKPLSFEEELKRTLDLTIGTIEDNPYIPHVPFKQQLEFLTLPDLEAFYGGAAGGGKSDALLMAALQYVQEEDYGALVIRRTLRELKKRGALITRSHEWLRNTDAHWNGQDFVWTFPSGATLEFGYVSNDQDLGQYDSAEYQFIGLDELTAFTEYQYTTLFGRLRRLEDSDIPIRMRGASNPGRIGHRWVKKRFVRGPFVFVPSTYLDNPHIDRAMQELTLNKLDHIERKRKKEGNWDVGAEGGLFNRLWFNRVGAFRQDDIVKAVRYWDFAATEKVRESRRTTTRGQTQKAEDPDWTVGLLALRHENNRMTIADVKRFQWSPHKTDEMIEITLMEDYYKYGRKLETHLEQEGGASGPRDVDHLIRKFAGYIVKPDPVKISKYERARPLSAYAEAGNVDVLDAFWTDVFLEELDFFPDATEHDDQVDTASGAYGKLFPVGRGNKRPRFDVVRI